MSSTITFRVFPPEGNVFLPGAFDAVIGATLRIAGYPAVLAVAVVADGGTSADVTIEASPALTKTLARGGAGELQVAEEAIMAVSPAVSPPRLITGIDLTCGSVGISHAADCTAATTVAGVVEDRPWHRAVADAGEDDVSATAEDATRGPAAGTVNRQMTWRADS